MYSSRYAMWFLFLSWLPKGKINRFIKFNAYLVGAMNVLSVEGRINKYQFSFSSLWETDYESFI